MYLFGFVSTLGKVSLPLTGRGVIAAMSEFVIIDGHSLFLYFCFTPVWFGVVPGHHLCVSGGLLSERPADRCPALVCEAGPLVNK